MALEPVRHVIGEDHASSSRHGLPLDLPDDDGAFVAPYLVLRRLDARQRRDNPREMWCPEALPAHRLPAMRDRLPAGPAGPAGSAPDYRRVLQVRLRWTASRTDLPDRSADRSDSGRPHAPEQSEARRPWERGSVRAGMGLSGARAANLISPPIRWGSCRNCSPLGSGH